MKRALLVSPYFLPCNLAGVHRARLLAKGLPEFGWKPTVLTVDPRFYGHLSEPKLAELIPDDLHIEYVDAIPGAVSKVFGIGDLSLRSLAQMRRRMGALLAAKKADLVFVTVLPGYAGLLGGWAKRRFGVPFVLDYQDPWVSDWGAAQPRFSKSGLAHWLAEKLEPRFAPLADAVTAVSNGTLDGLRTRGLLRPDTPTAALPIGSDPQDHEVARRVGKNYIQKEPGFLHVVYLGTVPEKKLPVLKAIFRQIASRPEIKLRLHLIGTSGWVEGDDSIGLGKMAVQSGAGESVLVEPRRIAYLDALRTMQSADVLVMLGSMERHYTASKVFPYWLADRPIAGVAHEESTVVEIGRELGGISLSKYSGENDLEQAAAGLLKTLAALSMGDASMIPPRNPAAFAPYDARGIARAYAGIFDNTMAAHERR
ncbi:MAG TPA: glycosyltransferase [Chthoniobacterales bacterium]|nr:glycosyltransferase [Chthoniobacterales bacterium]